MKTYLVTGVAVAVLTLAGIWATGALISNDFRTSMALTAVWMTAVPLALWFGTTRRRGFRIAVISGYAIVAIVAGGYLARTTLFDTTVDEDVAVGVPASQLVSQPAATPAPAPARTATPKTEATPQDVQLSSGKFSSLSHETSGTASIVKTAAGKVVLTLTDFETDPGPDFRVYVTDEGGQNSTGDYVDLGGLKGNKGNQQYTLPEDIDLDKRTTILIWCRAFTVGVGVAKLSAS